MDPRYERLKEKAVETAERIGMPSFYSEHAQEIGISRSSYSGSGVVRRCRDLIDRSGMHPAHGMDHLDKVAVEAGAIVRIEGRVRGSCAAEQESLMLCAQLAGLLHDIRRAEKDHTVTGSIEAGKILGEVGVEKRDIGYITAAIRNHEAFREVMPAEDETAGLISDSLYDADKFRWGPDNFTTTLWLMLESGGTTVEMLYCNFREKMGWIRRIKDTFRTRTGRRYGPEFIDQGIEIGGEIYSELEMLVGDTRCG